MFFVGKLGVMGIRCFSHLDVETVKFTRPLTLILGSNGTGKTTIVECLRMALTGEVPPNSNKGHSFIHDPKMEKLNEVKGQIRLVMDHRDGDRKIGIVRNLQLTLKRDRKDVTFKQMDSVLQVKDNDGKVISTSNKCLDINSSILSLLKVPKAVLDNVILCHQDEALWPLSDPVLLKKRFDELLGFNRYVRTLEVVATLRKKLSKIVLGKKTDLALLQKDETNRRAVAERLSKYQDQLRRMDEQLAELTAQKGQASQTVSNLQDVLRTGEANFNRTVSIKKTLGDQILEDSLEDIKATRQKYELEQKADEVEMEDVVAEIRTLETQIHELLTKKAEYADRHEEKIKTTTRRDCLQEEVYQLWFRIFPRCQSSPDSSQLERLLAAAKAEAIASVDIASLSQVAKLAESELIAAKNTYFELETNLMAMRRSIEGAAAAAAQETQRTAELRLEQSRQVSTLQQLMAQFGLSWTNASLSNHLDSFMSFLDEREGQLAKAAQKAEIHDKLRPLEAERDRIVKTLKKETQSEEELRNAVNAIQLECKLTDLRSCVTSSADQKSSAAAVEKAYHEFCMAQDAFTLYSNFKEYSSRKRKCALCFRGFQDDAQFAAHTKALDSKLNESIKPKLEATKQKFSKATAGMDLAMAISANAVATPRSQAERDMEMRELAAELERRAKLQECDQSMRTLQDMLAGNENSKTGNSAETRKRSRRSMTSGTEPVSDLVALGSEKIHFERKRVHSAIDIVKRIQIGAEHVAKRLAEGTQTQAATNSAAQSDCVQLELEVAKARDAHSAAQRAHDAAAKSMNKAQTSRDQSLQELEEGGQTIKRYLADIENLERSMELEEIEGVVEDPSLDLKNLQQGLSDDRDCLQVLRKKLAVRATMMETLDRNIELKELLQTAPEDFEKRRGECLRSQAMLEKVAGEMNRLLGEKKSYESLCGELRSELAKFDNLDSQLHRVSCEVAVNNMMSEDLGRYCNALRQSMLVYHNSKLTEINVIAKDLWRSVYAGSDIEYIFLKTERSTGKTEDLSYTYKLCMMKSDTETEMRGRCSAGQKVIASIILRLALIEVLGRRCGILALDEPTTNLDLKNIESLAAAISKLTSSKRHAENFQLIVITHDEDFLNKLRQQTAASYCRLVRDIKTGYTKCCNERAL